MIFARSLGCGQPRPGADGRFRFLALGFFPSPSSSFRAATNAFIASGDTVGYFRSSPSIAPTTMSATRARATYLRSAGVTYQGAHLVLVAESALSNASWYSLQNLRSPISDGETFQYLSELVRRSRNRFFCSLLERCRKNLRISVPFLVRCP